MTDGNGQLRRHSGLDHHQKTGIGRVIGVVVTRGRIGDTGKIHGGDVLAATTATGLAIDTHRIPHDLRQGVVGRIPVTGHQRIHNEGVGQPWGRKIGLLIEGHIDKGAGSDRGHNVLREGSRNPTPIVNRVLDIEAALGLAPIIGYSDRHILARGQTVSRNRRHEGTDTDVMGELGRI